MHTRCPSCQAVFQVGRSHLEAAGGRVRCGECGRVFDARASLQRELPLGEPPVAGAGVRTSTPPPRFGETLPGILRADLEAEIAPAARRRSGWAVAGWAAVNLLLLLAFAAQLLLLQREVFAQDPGMRPVLSRICEVTGCSLPSRRAVERIELLRRQVYAHPNIDDALLIDVTLVNGASFAQPFPVLSVTLGDLRGRPVARRHFAPREYHPRLARSARMAPGSPVNIVLEVRDPGPEARTFDLDFH